jgi:predicted nuclease of predicted toxin-antitoxin system
VRFLLDECLLPQMAELLRAAGHDCAHTCELGLGGQPDEQIMALADRDNRILISADTDFGELLANAPVLAPSVILLRRTDKRAGSLAAVVIANLEQVTEDLAAGRADRNQRHPHPRTTTPHETVRLSADTEPAGSPGRIRPRRGDATQHFTNMPPTERSAGACARAAWCCSTVRPGGPGSPSGQCHGVDGRYRE